MEPDFSGWATKAGIRCSDGRTIMPGAFAHHDKQRVPLVWQHQHDGPANVLGYAVLEHRDEGVYAYGFFNDTEAGVMAKGLVQHGDVNQLSIFANNLVESQKNVTHGNIRELSLVLAGANSGAVIENVALAHGDGVEYLMEEAIIMTGLTLEHADGGDDSDEGDEGDEDGATIQEAVESMNEDQKAALYYLVAQAAGDEGNDSGDSGDEGGNAQHKQGDEPGDKDTITHSEGDRTNMTSHNVFDQSAIDPKAGLRAQAQATLTHDALSAISENAQKLGSFKDAVLAHATQYGITDIDMLFPDAKTIMNAPELIGRRVEWVNSVISGTRKSPFSRIKTMSADITHEEARAKGYIKGTMKKEEFFGLAKRITTPTTIYKKQKLDRDDIIDITDFDVVAWLKGEMRLMLDEELARAILLGDGRAVDDDDKIKDPASNSDGAGIRSIAHDHDFYAHRVTVPANVSPRGFIEAILRSRKHYRGSGNPTMYCTEDLVTDLLLVEDNIGRRLYQTMNDLQAALRVSNIVTVDQMEGVETAEGELQAILVNISDYTLGADRGGAVSMFDDFDIDFNQFKYLIETRVSGTLTKYKSAVVVSRAAGGTERVPVAPTFNNTTGVVTIPDVDGVEYVNQAFPEVPLTAGAQNAIAQGSSVTILAEPEAEGDYLKQGVTKTWTFTRPSA